jgi:hypothetical protein
MREICTSGSVGDLGEQPPRSTRQTALSWEQYKLSIRKRKAIH